MRFNLADIDEIIDQYSLMLHTFFHALSEADSLPPVCLGWSDIMELLLELMQSTKSPISSRITKDIIPQDIRSVFHKHRSIPHLSQIGTFVVRWGLNFNFELFTVLDEIMAALCNNPVNVVGITPENLQKWKALRETIVRRGSNLPDRYFEGLHPCLALESVELGGRWIRVVYPRRPLPMLPRLERITIRGRGKIF